MSKINKLFSSMNEGVFKDSGAKLDDFKKFVKLVEDASNAYMKASIFWTESKPEFSDFLAEHGVEGFPGDLSMDDYALEFRDWSDSLKKLYLKAKKEK